MKKVVSFRRWNVTWQQFKWNLSTKYLNGIFKNCGIPVVIAVTLLLLPLLLFSAHLRKKPTKHFVIVLNSLQVSITFSEFTTQKKNKIKKRRGKSSAINMKGFCQFRGGCSVCKCCRCFSLFPSAVKMLSVMKIPWKKTKHNKQKKFKFSALELALHLGYFVRSGYYEIFAIRTLMDYAP